MYFRNYLVVVVLMAAPLLAQVSSSGAVPAGESGALWGAGDSSDAEVAGETAPMITPALLSGEGYSLAFASETPRTNFLRGGLSFGTAYDDNVLPSSGHAISDVRYSIWPNLSLQQSRARLAWSLNYSPGFGVYQHNSSINEIDHYLTVDLSYRWTPHVTLSLKESFQKTSNLMNLSQSAGAPDTYVTAPSTESLVAPAIARTSSFTEVEVNYQFGPNAKVGAKGTLSGLWYANQADVTGLFNSTAQGTELYYSHRFSQKQYVGVTYGFQRFLTIPDNVKLILKALYCFTHLICLRPSRFPSSRGQSTQTRAAGPRQCLASRHRRWEAVWDGTETGPASSWAIRNGSAIVVACRGLSAPTVLIPRSAGDWPGQ